MERVRDEITFLQPPSYDPYRFMENESPEPAPSEGETESETAVTITRSDGWTPFARRLFLEVLAETGRVTAACEYARLTKQSAYALRARDAAFAAGWDAACELARAPLADALYEKAVDGVTDTITKDGEVVAERHRFDSRLSIAVLHRLDKRCDRAAELGAHHLAIVRHWDEWLALVGKGDETATSALLASARHGQLGQLPLGENPTGEPEEPEEDRYLDLSARTWKDPIDDIWLTDFPPPPGFDGYEKCEWGDPTETYERACTAEEAAILDADAAGDIEVERAEEADLRDRWFAYLAGRLEDAGENVDEDEIADADKEEERDDPKASRLAAAAPSPAHSLPGARPAPGPA